MAALDFPSDPVDAELWDAPNGVRYKWSEADGLWTVAPADVVEEPSTRRPRPAAAAVSARCRRAAPLSAGYRATNVDVVIQLSDRDQRQRGRLVGDDWRLYAASGLVLHPMHLRRAGSDRRQRDMEPHAAQERRAYPRHGRQHSGGPQFSVPITVGVYVEANGTDTFDFVAQTNAAGMYPQGNTFTAFPLWVAP